MDRRTRGFSLIELMVVIAIISVIAVIAIPNLIASRLPANETAAIAMMRHLVAVQAQFQQGGKADTDADTRGEYGGFAELSGGVAGRMPGPLVPPVLSGGFRVLNANGEANRSGYFFRIYLPGAMGVGVGEPTIGYTALSGVDGDLAENTWCAYAWPVHHSRSGHRTFFTNQAGEVLSCHVPDWSGSGGGPPADAAFAAAGAITGKVDIGGPGQAPMAAQATWVQVN